MNRAPMSQVGRDTRSHYSSADRRSHSVGLLLRDSSPPGWCPSRSGQAPTRSLSLGARVVRLVHLVDGRVPQATLKIVVVNVVDLDSPLLSAVLSDDRGKVWQSRSSKRQIALSVKKSRGECRTLPSPLLG